MISCMLTITPAGHPSNYVAVTAFPSFTEASSERRLDQAYYMVDVDNRYNRGLARNFDVILIVRSAFHQGYPTLFTPAI